jgi:hypothetical protein
MVDTTLSIDFGKGQPHTHNVIKHSEHYVIIVVFYSRKTHWANDAFGYPT